MIKSLPHDGTIVRFWMKVSLFNTFVYDSFLHYRSFETERSSRYIPRHRIPEKVFSFDHDDKSLNYDSDSPQERNYDATFGKIIDSISKYSNRFRYYRVVFMVVFLLITIKETIIICLKYLPEDSSYRLIDCFLLGRTTLSGTYTQVSQRMSLLLVLSQSAWILYLLIGKPVVRLGCLEFLLYTGDQVKAIELGANDRSQSAVCSGPRRSTHTAEGPTIGYETKFVDSLQHKMIKFPVFQYREPLLRSAERSKRGLPRKSSIRFRKNRDFKCWSNIFRSASKFQTYCIYLTSVLWVPYLFSFVSVIATRQGFELNYSTCTNYLKLIDREDQKFSFIYHVDANQINITKPLSFFLELTDTIAINEPYHQIRLIIDFMQSFFVVNGAAIAFISHTYYLVIIARDVENYLDTLEDEFERLVCDLRCRRADGRQTLCLYGGLILDGKVVDVPTFGQVRRKSSESERNLNLNQIISDLQAQSMDFWKTIAQYNTYIKTFLSITITIWVVFSVLAAEFLLAPNGVIFYDLIGSQLVSSAYFIGVIGQLAKITQRIRCLYPKMASAMALDDDCTGTKTRWPTMLSYFHPQPLYCFTIAGFTISWNFCLQVSATVQSSSH